MEFLAEYGLFLAKSVTIVIAIIIVIGAIASMGAKQRKPAGAGGTSGSGNIEIRHLNEELKERLNALKGFILEKHVLKEENKAEKKALKDQEKADKEAFKAAQKAPEPTPIQHKKRVYVLDFDGDIKAQAVESLRREITAILGIADSSDEVVLRLESGGGMVHAYGLASSQLKRITDKSIPLTICIDKVAASGGYMMACIADRIVAAPFSIVGSIGVVAQLPNFHRLLKKNDVDFEMLTAGEYKRTLTMFGEKHR